MPCLTLSERVFSLTTLQKLWLTGSYMGVCIQWTYLRWASESKAAVKVPEIHVCELIEAAAAGHLSDWILMSLRYVGLKHTNTHSWPCCRGMSLACSSVVMDTPRHIRHPICGGMLSASEGLAPTPPPPNPYSLSPFPPKGNPCPLIPPKQTQHQLSITWKHTAAAVSPPVLVSSSLLTGRLEM